MAIQWNDVYKIGNPEIDAEHQEIFKRANAFLDVIDIADMTAYAIGFFQYTRDHFSHEESLMRDLDYPAIAEHMQQHKDLTAGLNEIAKKIGTEEWHRQELELLLADWLLDHIRMDDAQLAAYINQKVPAHRPTSSNHVALPQRA